MTVYIPCPYCGRNFKLRDIRGGDGSARKLKYHYRHVPVTNNMGITILPGTKTVCEGSYALFDPNGKRI